MEFKFVKVLGSGAYGTVSLYENKEGKQRVIKEIKIGKTNTMSKDTEGQIIEQMLCSLLDHKNIVKCFSSKLSKGTLELTFEYANGGDLFDYVDKHGKMSEPETKVVIKDILKALKYCHNELKVCHADLKPENILVFEGKEGPVYKIADWGLSEKSDKEIKKTDGTIVYMAPEIINGKNYYCDKTDMWALGCIMYFCLTEEYLFDDELQQQICQNIDHSVDIKQTIDSMNISDDAKDLMIRFFGEKSDIRKKQRDPNKRISAEEALKHDWFKTD